MLLFSQSRLIAGQESKWYLVADLTAILFPYLAFVCLAAAFGAALNVLGRFTEPALSPIWLNLCMIGSLVGAGLLWQAGDSAIAGWLCGGVLLGGFFQMMVPAVVLMREGWRPRFDLGRSGPVREIAALMAPGLFGTAIYQINVYVSRLFAFSIQEGEASLFFYANRLMELPIGVFAVAVSTVHNFIQNEVSAYITSQGEKEIMAGGDITVSASVDWAKIRGVEAVTASVSASSFGGSGVFFKGRHGFNPQHIRAASFQRLGLFVENLDRQRMGHCAHGFKNLSRGAH
jgi:hypothetical protein